MNELPDLESLELYGTAPGLPDECFDHDGLITKRHQRASAFAFLRPTPGQLMWDIGTGSGAMAIEWCRAAPKAKAIGVERNRERAERARRNANRMTPGQVQIIESDAASTLASLPTPDAVFLGGGMTAATLDACRAALTAGGRLVAHAVTLETEILLTDAFQAHGGELSRISVEHIEPLGRFHGWKPLRTLTQWAFRA